MLEGHTHGGTSKLVVANIAFSKLLILKRPSFPWHQVLSGKSFVEYEIFIRKPLKSPEWWSVRPFRQGSYDDLSVGKGVGEIHSQRKR